MTIDKPTVSFDVDDVLADFHKKYRALAMELFPQHDLPPASGWDGANWPITDHDRTLLNMTWKTIPNFYADLDLCPGVKPMALHMLASRANLIFVTSRHHHPETPAYAQTVKWIQEKLSIHDPIVVVTEDKPPVLRATRAIVHVDDRPQTLARLPIEARLPDGYTLRSTLGILMRAPANADMSTWGYGSLAETFDDAIHKVQIVLQHWENSHGLSAY